MPAGSVVGEVGFLDGRPRTHHVRARTACRLRRITREGFSSCDRRRRCFREDDVALAELLAARYRAVTEELEPVRALAGVAAGGRRPIRDVQPLRGARRPWPGSRASAPRATATRSF